MEPFKADQVMLIGFNSAESASVLEMLEAIAPGIIKLGRIYHNSDVASDVADTSENDASCLVILGEDVSVTTGLNMTLYKNAYVISVLFGNNGSSTTLFCTGSKHRTHQRITEEGAGSKAWLEDEPSIEFTFKNGQWQPDEGFQGKPAPFVAG